MDHSIDNNRIALCDNALTYVDLNCFTIIWKKKKKCKTLNTTCYGAMNMKYLEMKKTPHIKNETENGTKTFALNNFCAIVIIHI